MLGCLSLLTVAIKAPGSLSGAINRTPLTRPITRMSKQDEHADAILDTLAHAGDADATHLDTSRGDICAPVART
ncbi:hypothetical protein AOQ73_24075 [Bradyrhizobium pachyrhizi]|nr:hypothetical protein AOQ73_24075 [Bradyrhizobium pachyrhizi]